MERAFKVEWLYMFLWPNCNTNRLMLWSSRLKCCSNVAQMLDSSIHYCAKVESVIHLFNIVWILITWTCTIAILLVDNIEAQFTDIIVPPILWQRVVPTYRYWELANQTSPVIKRISYSKLSSHITLFLKCYAYAWQWWFFSSKLIFSIHVIVHFFIIWSTLVTKPSWRKVLQ